MNQIAPYRGVETFDEQTWQHLERETKFLLHLLQQRVELIDGFARRNDAAWQANVKRAISDVAAFHDDGWRGE